MAFRLGDYVIYGELVCTHHYAVTGMIALKTGADETEGDYLQLVLNLTGLPEPFLRGKHIRFRPANPESVSCFEYSRHPRINPLQIGATGDIIASGWVRMLPCPVEEYLTRSRLGEPPPTPWKNRVYIEWYGNNGRTVVEMGDVVLERCLRCPDIRDENDEGEWAPLENPEPEPEPYVHRPGNAQLGDIEVHEIRDTGEVIRHRGADFDREGGDLQRMLDEEAAAIDRAIAGDDADSGDEANLDDYEATALIDDCLTYQNETPLTELLRGLGPLPRPDSLSDDAVETRFKTLVGQLALFGIGFHVCDHCSPRDAYRIFVERVLPDEGAFEGLIGTGWTQNFMTSEYCAACDAEAEREYEARSRELEGEEDESGW